jgi:hypothetical protein
VTLFFNPADFYDWQPVSEGFSIEGGMFKLHEIWEGPNTHDSFFLSGRPLLDNLKTSLGPSEGIGFFNVDLEQTENGQIWGQFIQTPISVDAVIAPPGWTGEIDGNLVSWEAGDPSLLIRPDTTAYDDGRSFGFRFTTNEAIVGTDQTIWFGGFNSAAFFPAITFGDFAAGFSSNDLDMPGTGFEATLRLTAIPEPATMFLGAIGLLAFLHRSKLRR